jgi:hypothetical protein
MRTVREARRARGAGAMKALATEARDKRAITFILVF